MTAPARPLPARSLPARSLPALLPRAAGLAAFLAVVVIVLPVSPVVAATCCATLLVCCLAADWVLCPRPERFRVERRHARIVSMGERAALRWSVRSTAGRRATVGLVDELPPSFGAPARGCRVVIPAMGSGEGAVEIRPTRRGHFSFSSVTVRVHGPMGLVARQGLRPAPSEIAVYPALGAAREADLWVRRSRVAEVGLRSARFHGGGSEFDSLREYTVDDEFRRIDWSASARASRPIVRTYRAEVDQRLVCLLDAGRTMSGTVEGVARFEHALDALLMLTAVSTRLGDRCGVVVFDDSVRTSVAPARLSGQLGRVSEAVYRVHPALVESDYHGAFTYLLGHFGRHSLVVLFSELVESAVAESLVPALALIAREHRVVVASVADPRIASWSRDRATDVDGAYRKAAARWDLERRRRTSALLAARGVAVVDAPPQRLPHEISDYYVRAKAMGPL